MATETRRCRIKGLVYQYPRDEHNVPDRDAEPLGKFVSLSVNGADCLIRIPLGEVGLNNRTGWTLPVQAEFGLPHPGRQYQDKVTKVWITPTVCDISGEVTVFLSQAEEPAPAIIA